MARRKTPAAPKSPKKQVSPPPVDTASPAPKGKWFALGILVLAVVFTALWSAGVFKNINAGPKIPLPRQAADFTLGSSKEDFLQKFPKAKKKFRSFNNDKLFSIVTLDNSMGLNNPSTADILFFKDRLYFVSAAWEAEQAQTVPLESWVKQYRRWNRNTSQGTETLGPKVKLKEWHFKDDATEMILRDLDSPGHIQRWQELRDASDTEAQGAFAKYRLDLAS
jgi:hypothetical protein